jgi:hypothetical protein
MAKIRKCITLDEKTVKYLESIGKKYDLSFSYLVNYYSNEFCKFHKEEVLRQMGGSNG